MKFYCPSAKAEVIAEIDTIINFSTVTRISIPDKRFVSVYHLCSDGINDLLGKLGQNFTHFTKMRTREC